MELHTLLLVVVDLRVNDPDASVEEVGEDCQKDEPTNHFSD
jgi:hypothetical protein